MTTCLMHKLKFHNSCPPYLPQNIFKESLSFEVDFFLLIFAACLTPLGSPVAQNWRVVSPYFFYGLGTAMCRVLIEYFKCNIILWVFKERVKKKFSAIRNHLNCKTGNVQFITYNEEMGRKLQLNCQHISS